MLARCSLPLAVSLLLIASCEGGIADDNEASDASAGDVPDARIGSDGDVTAEGPNVDRSNPQLFDFGLDPKELDASTSDSLSTQFAVLDTRVEPVGTLIVFLPGANNVPGDWHNHGRKLAEFGFHVLVPHYNNRWSSQGVCDGQGGSCGVDTRWEALTGEDASSAIAISRADSVEGRVVTMLAHLATANPEGDWGFFLDGADGIKYNKIIIAGISHGAASTALYATRHGFSRAVMHSGGPVNNVDTPATPVDVWYGLAHTEDPQYGGIVGGWNNANMPGEVVSIDDATPPYGGAHMLESSTSNCYPHCSTVVHSCSPPESPPDYDYEDAWRYMYGL